MIIKFIFILVKLLTGPINKTENIVSYSGVMPDRQ